MLTCCPRCESWFRVRAEHLSAAAGQVTCGECNTVFDALPSLVEERDGSAAVELGDLVPAPTPEPTAASMSEPDPEPERELEPDPAPVVVEAPVISAESAALAFAFAPGNDSRFDELPAPLVTHSLSADEHAILFTEPGSDAPLEDTIPEARAMVDALYGELGPPPLPPRRTGWRVLGALFAIVLLAQLAWYARSWVELWLPASVGWYTTLCTRLACAQPPATSRIRLIARDVREHPQYRNALLVNATLVNEAAEPQPYPVIELRLHDAGGRVLGARRFAPTEYLDQSIALGDGMPPARPVYIVLELGGDAATAASFEFTFL